jgi:MFS family permease
MKGEFSATMQKRSRWALGLGVICLALCVIGWIISPREFFIGYLFAVLVWLGLALGCMAFLMIHYLTGGKWGWPVRRFFEGAAGTLPLLALLFVPVFFGFHELYPWAREAQVAANKVLEHKHAYQNAPMFIVRAAICFGIWIVMGQLFNRWSYQQDATRDPTPMKKLRTLSGPGLVIYPVTITFAYVDWIMSLEANWYSTMFPILICIGQMLSGLAFVIILLDWIGPRSALAEIISKENFHHLGSLLLAITMMWAYLAFGQLIVIWSGDLPHEIVWYLHRIAGGWRWVIAFLVLFHFFGPFFLLLSRQTKRSPRALTSIAVVMVIAHMVDVWWMITPSFYPHGVHVSWLNFAALFGTGGLWFSYFCYRLDRRSLVPLNDPRFAVALAPSL